MTVLQTGTFRHGTFGFPIEVTLSSSPISLVGCTAIHLDMKRPNEVVAGISRALVLPGAIVNATTGVITWDVLNGDLPVIGNYSFTLTIAFGPSEQLVVDGEMKVS